MTKMRRLLGMFAAFWVLPFALLAQSITGLVTDAKTGDPIPFLNVAVKGTNRGTTTDLAGKYSIAAPAQSILQFSAMGYKAVEIEVSTQTVINVSMEEDATLLDDVVVIAGAVFRKKDLTGAVSSIGSEKIAQLPVTTVSEALNGRLTGVRPSSGGSVRVRGYNSISYGTNPIFVVDGVVTEGGFDLINPNDIASIDVLKDASSTAIYGARGANGVVVITTKKGTEREGRVSYDTWLGIERFSNDLPGLDTRQLFDLRLDALANVYMDENPGADRQAYIDRLMNEENSPYFADYERDSYRNNRTYDWLDPLLRTGVQQNHNISFSGASERSNYFLSFNFTDHKGWLENNHSKRYNGKVNLENKVKPWLTVGTSSSFTRNKSSMLDGSAYNTALYANPMFPVNDTTMTLYWGKTQDLDAPNPLRSKKIDWDSFTNRFLSANYINIRPIEGLDIRTTFSVDAIEQKEFYYRPADTYQGSRENQDGEASHKKDSWLNWQWDNTVTYARTFAQDHSLSVMGGFSMSKNNWDYNSIKAYKFVTDDFSYKYLGGSYAEDEKYIASDFQASTLASYIMRANYSYANKYFVTLTGRVDGSSRFGKNNIYGFFPSAALAWDLSQEEFMRNLYEFDVLKLRLGYGVSGNQNIPLYSYVTNYYPMGSGGNVTYRPGSTLGNPDISWEKQKQLNIGLDVSMLNRRLSFTFEYFNIRNEDLLMYKPLAFTSGFSGMISNVGAIRNRGVEFSFNARIIDNSLFSWDFAGNISRDKNKVTRLYGNTDAIYKYSYQTIQRTGNLIVGKSLNSIYSYKFDKIVQESDLAGLENLDLGGRVVRPGDILPVNHVDDGAINQKDMHVAGYLDPKFFGGFSTTLRYRDFELTALFDYQVGQKTINSLYEWMMSGNGMTISHPDMQKRWTPENTDTNVPRAYFQRGARFQIQETDWAVRNDSYLNLTALTLSYSLPEQLLSDIGLSRARVYFTGNNLLRLNANKMSKYLQVRKYVFGLNLSF